MGWTPRTAKVLARDVVAAQAFRRAAAHQDDVIGSGGGDAGEDVRPLRASARIGGRVDAPGAARLIGHADLRRGERVDVVVRGRDR